MRRGLKVGLGVTLIVLGGLFGLVTAMSIGGAEQVALPVLALAVMLAGVGLVLMGMSTSH